MSWIVIQRQYLLSIVIAFLSASNNYEYILSDKLVVSTSCSLMHTAVDLVNETKLDSEIKSWLAFAAQKVVEVNALGKALAGQKDEVCYSFIFSLYFGALHHFNWNC
jgi:hypothetical protein